MNLRNLIFSLAVWPVFLTPEIALAAFGEVEFKCNLKTPYTKNDCAKKAFKDLQNAGCLPELNYWCKEEGGNNICRIKAGRCASPYLWKDAFPTGQKKIPDHLECRGTSGEKWIVKKMTLALAEAQSVERDICVLDISNEKPPTQLDCSSKTDLSQERVVAPTVAGAKVPFGSSSAQKGSDKGPFVIGGDLVMVTPDYKLTNWNSWPYPPSVCARFKKTERAKQASRFGHEVAALAITPFALNNLVLKMILNKSLLLNYANGTKRDQPYD